MALQNIKVIIFDFDGTISDSHDAMVSVYHSIARKFGYQEIAVDVIRNQSSRQSLREMGIPLYKVPSIVREARRQFQTHVHALRPIVGVPEALRDIKGLGFQIGILTSNSSENVDHFLKRNELELFDFISTDAGMFSKGRILKKIIKSRGILHQEAIYVGDETRDVEAAQKAGIPIVAVGWGLNSKASLMKCKPDFIVDQPGELTALFRDSLKAAKEAAQKVTNYDA